MQSCSPQRWYARMGPGKPAAARCRLSMAQIIGRQGEARCMRIDKAGLLCYKHNALARG
jgi:hypothetical protein